MFDLIGQVIDLATGHTTLPATQFVHHDPQATDRADDPSDEPDIAEAKDYKTSQARLMAASPRHTTVAHSAFAV